MSAASARQLMKAAAAARALADSLDELRLVLEGNGDPATIANTDIARARQALRRLGLGNKRAPR
jgi:hypothetical protein